MGGDEADAGAEPMAGYDEKGTKRIFQSFRHTLIVIDSWTQQTLIESRSEPPEFPPAQKEDPRESLRRTQPLRKSPRIGSDSFFSAAGVEFPTPCPTTRRTAPIFPQPTGTYWPGQCLRGQSFQIWLKFPPQWPPWSSHKRARAG